MVGQLPWWKIKQGWIWGGVRAPPPHPITAQVRRDGLRIQWRILSPLRAAQPNLHFLQELLMRLWVLQECLLLSGSGRSVFFFLPWALFAVIRCQRWHPIFGIFFWQCFVIMEAMCFPWNWKLWSIVFLSHTSQNKLLVMQDRPNKPFSLQVLTLSIHWLLYPIFWLHYYIYYIPPSLMDLKTTWCLLLSHILILLRFDTVPSWGYCIEAELAVCVCVCMICTSLNVS